MVTAVCGYKDSSGKFHETKAAAEKADIYNEVVRVIDGLPKNRTSYGYYDGPTSHCIATKLMDSFDVSTKTYVAEDTCKCDNGGV